MATHILSIAVAVSAVLSGLWLGEHPDGPLPTRDFFVLLFFAVAAAWPLWPANRAASALTGLGTALVFCAPWLAGRHEANYAFNDCVQNGEQVLGSLASYRAIHGAFQSPSQNSTATRK